jgi:hypothetical protein
VGICVYFNINLEQRTLKENGSEMGSEVTTEDDKFSSKE